MGYTILFDICWAAAGLVWLGGAVYNLFKAPAAFKKSAGSLIPTLVGIALLLANRFWGPAKFWAALSLRSEALSGIGALVLLVGTLFTLWARFSLGTMWSSDPISRESHALKTTGPYALTRNPIYTGALVMFVGTALMSGLGVWIFYFLVGVVYFEIKIRLEEKLLTETLGGAYARYCQQVPQLIPGLNLLRRRPHAGG